MKRINPKEFISFGELAFSITSHAALNRVLRSNVSGVKWIGPANLGSKTKMYRADDTPANRTCIERAGGHIYA